MIKAIKKDFQLFKSEVRAMRKLDVLYAVIVGFVLISMILDVFLNWSGAWN